MYDLGKHRQTTPAVAALVAPFLLFFCTAGSQLLPVEYGSLRPDSSRSEANYGANMA